MRVIDTSPRSYEGVLLGLRVVAVGGEGGDHEAAGGLGAEVHRRGQCGLDAAADELGDGRVPVRVASLPHTWLVTMARPPTRVEDLLERGASRHLALDVRRALGAHLALGQRCQQRLVLLDVPPFLGDRRGEPLAGAGVLLRTGRRT